MLGSPRRPTISTPTNPMHVTHVSIDNETGDYTVRDTLGLPYTCASTQLQTKLFRAMRLTRIL
jgi:hypothetical protein